MEKKAKKDIVLELTHVSKSFPGVKAPDESVGVATIHQELSPVLDLTVAENIFLGAQPQSKLGSSVGKSRRFFPFLTSRFPKKTCPITGHHN